MGETYEVDPDGDLLISLVTSVQNFVGNDEASTEPPANSETFDHTETTYRTIPISLDTVNDSTNTQASFKVSSKHLTVASRRFHKMLSGDWVEANKVYSDGCRHVDLEDIFDLNALRILLDILHGKTRSVPRSLELEMLTKVAVLVDDFGCHEAVEVWSDMWIQHLEDSLPKDSTEDLISWILISVVFHKPAPFKEITRIAVMHESDLINTSGLPIPESVDISVNDKRVELIQQLINVLYGLVDDLRKGNTLHDFEHDSMLLGTLLKQMDQLGIPWSRPEAPFSGFSFVGMAGDISSFQTPRCSTFYPIEEGYYGKRKKKRFQQNWGDESVCAEDQNLCDLLTPEIKRLREGVSGLHLKDHLRRKDN